MSDTASVWVVRSLALVAAVALGSSLGCTFHSAQPSSASGSAVEARSAAAVSQAFAQAWVSGDGAGLAETLCSSGTIPSPIIPLAIAPGKVDNVRLIGVAQHGPESKGDRRTDAPFRGLPRPLRGRSRWSHDPRCCRGESRDARVSERLREGVSVGPRLRMT